jgi:hypothetical protein
MDTDNTTAGETVVRKRHNLTLAEDVRQMGDDMAQADRRSFSNLVEWLVQQEWARRRGYGKKEVAS